MKNNRIPKGISLHPYNKQSEMCIPINNNYLLNNDLNPPNQSNNHLIPNNFNNQINNLIGNINSTLIKYQQNKLPNKIDLNQNNIINNNFNNNNNNFNALEHRFNSFNILKDNNSKKKQIPQGTSQSLNMIISANEKTLIKDFLNYNLFYILRDEKELFELQSEFHQKAFLRQIKWITDNSLLEKLNSPEFQNEFLISDYEDIQEESMKLDRNRIVDTKKKFSLSDLKNIESNNINFIIYEKHKESYHDEINLVDSFLSNNEGYNTKHEKVESLKDNNTNSLVNYLLKNNVEILNKKNKISNFDINQTKANQLPNGLNANISTLKVKRKTSYLNFFNSEEYNSENIEKIRSYQTSSENICNYKEKKPTLNSNRIASNVYNNNIINQCNDPLNYHDYIINEVSANKLNQKFNQINSTKYNNTEPNKNNNTVNTVNRAKPQRKNTKINLFQDDMSDIAIRLNSISKVNNPGILKFNSLNKQKYIKSSNNLKYPHLMNNNILHSDINITNNKSFVKSQYTSKHKNSVNSLIRKINNNFDNINQSIDNSNINSNFNSFLQVNKTNSNSKIVKSKFSELSQDACKGTNQNKINNKVGSKNFFTDINLKNYKKLTNNQIFFEDEYNSFIDINNIEHGLTKGGTLKNKTESNKDTVISLVIPPRYRKNSYDNDFNFNGNEKNISDEDIYNKGYLKNKRKKSVNKLFSKSLNDQKLNNIRNKYFECQDNNKQDYELKRLTTIYSKIDIKKILDNSVYNEDLSNNIELSNYQDIEIRKKKAEILISSNEFSSAEDSENTV